MRIVHHVPGRLRLRIAAAALYRARHLTLEGLRRLIEGIEGVEHLRLSPATLSAVVEYDQHVLSPSVWEALIEGPEPAARLMFEALTRSGQTT